VFNKGAKQMKLQIKTPECISSEVRTTNGTTIKIDDKLISRVYYVGLEIQTDEILKIRVDRFVTDDRNQVLLNEDRNDVLRETRYFAITQSINLSFDVTELNK